MLHKERGHRRMAGIIEKMSNVAKVEVPPRLMGRRLTMILAPDRAKIEQYKRQGQSPPEEPVPERTGEPELAPPALEKVPGEELEARQA